MQNLAPKSDQIGIFLPVPEERDAIVACLTGGNLTTVKLDDLSILQSPTLPEYDALILPISAWPAARHLLQVAARRRPRSARGPRSSSAPRRTPICPRSTPDEIGENVSFIRYPLEASLFPFQLRAILRRRKIVHDLRYRLKEREDVLRSISEVFFSVDHEFRYTFFNEKAQQVGGKSEQELLGQDMWEAFPSLKNTEFHRQMEQVARDRKILIAEYLGPITGDWFEMRIYPSAGGLSALFVDISARKKARRVSSRRRSNSARPMPTWNAPWPSAPPSCTKPTSGWRSSSTPSRTTCAPRCAACRASPRPSSMTTAPRSTTAPGNMAGA